MKSFKSVITKTALMLTLAAASNSFAGSPLQAQHARLAALETPGNIKFVSIEGDMLIFELHLSKLLPKGSVLKVADGEGNIIFEERTTAATYNIRYKIVKNDISKINFEISNRDFFLNQSFNVNSRVEEKIDVTKA